MTGISFCHKRAVSFLGQSSFCLFIALCNAAFMSSESELFKAGSLANLELEDLEGEDIVAQFAAPSLHLYNNNLFTLPQLG